MLLCISCCVIEMVVGANYSRLAAAEFSVGFLLNGGLRQRQVPSPSHWLGCYWFCSSKGCVGLLRFLRRAPFKKSGHLPNLRRNFLERWLMWLILAGMTSTSIARRPLSGMVAGYLCSSPCLFVLLRWRFRSSRFPCYGYGCVDLVKEFWRKSSVVRLMIQFTCRCFNLHIREAPSGFMHRHYLLQLALFQALPDSSSKKLPSTLQAAQREGPDCFFIFFLGPFLQNDLKCNLPFLQGFMCKTGCTPVMCARCTATTHESSMIY